MLDAVYSGLNRYAVAARENRRFEPGDPVLQWLIFAGLNVLAFLLLWFYGLLQKALAADPTHITLLISLIYIGTSLHCLWRCLAVSREADAEKQLAASVKAGAPLGTADGLVADHIRDLVTKSKLLSNGQKLDQALMLRVLAQRLNGSTPFGAFASDLAMKLGLFGTIVGFIMMLDPIAGLDTGNQAAVKTSMNLMSEGMAVAMYTTLAGLIGSILIRIQYYMLEDATSQLFAFAVGVIDVHAVAMLEREAEQAA